MGSTTDIDRCIARLAESQHGIVARRQLRRLRVRTDAIRRRVAAGRLLELSSRVLLVAGAPVTDDARLMAAVLDTGSDACVARESAAASWRLPGFRLDGVPVTTPTRTLFDLAAAPDVSELRMARLIDTAWARRLVSHASLTSMLDELAGKGRPGIVLMRELLEERPADHVPPESNTEARFEEIARLAGLRQLERQVDVGGDDGWIGRVDFIDRRRRLVIEVGDALFHGSLTDRRHDEARWSRLEAAGYAVETVDAFEVFHRADTLVARLRAVANTRNPLASGRTDDRFGGV